MSAHASRTPFELDPLIAEAKRRMKQRRLLVATLVAVLAGGAVGATLALRGPGGAGHTAGQSSAEARAAAQQLRYPAAWKRVFWGCWDGPGSMILLTTAKPTPTCGPTFPPLEHLGTNGVAVWFRLLPPLQNFAHTRALRVQRSLVGRSRVICTGRAAPGRPLAAQIDEPGDPALLVGAVVCGPNYSTSEAALHRLLASIRSARPWPEPWFTNLRNPPATCRSGNGRLGQCSGMTPEGAGR
jgi:hypothetical protein